MIFYLKKFLVACATKGSLAILGCETCVIMKPNHHKIGVGATEALSLRVSVAALVSMQFNSPEDGQVMLALERTATLREFGGRSEVVVRAKPFGGGVRLTNPQELEEMIGNFHYDSKRSRREMDFRIQIHPASWEKIKKICRGHLQETEKKILDFSPERELLEEFEDNLNVRITRDQYSLKLVEIIIEDSPEKTESVRAQGLPTVRIYYVFEARMNDPEIIKMMLSNSRRYSDRNLQIMALEDARRGGKGRANAILALGLNDLKELYGSIPMGRRNGPIHVGEHQLDGNVHAILMLP